jgi:hypothetical protein
MYNWTGLGAFGLLCIFQGSTWLTEKLSAQKYPEYKEYQRRVGRFIPRLSHELPGDSVEAEGIARLATKVKADGKKVDKGQKGSKKN